jgi:hypothetical protein
MSLATELSIALHPEQLMRAAALDPDPWQAELLQSQARQLLLLCSRQAGKSTVSAALALHEALYRPNSLVLMLAPALRQSQELFRKLLTFYRALHRPVRAEAESHLRLELANGSRVISLPGTEETIRGYSGVRLLVVDEAARVPDDLYFGVRPMLAVSNGRLLALSTPWGQRGWFHEEWTNGGEAWQRVRVPASDCPRISAAFLDGERRAMSPAWFAQEYECRFADTCDQVFSTEYIDNAFDPDLKPLWDGNL